MVEGKWKHLKKKAQLIISLNWLIKEKDSFKFKLQSFLPVLYPLVSIYQDGVGVQWVGSL